MFVFFEGETDDEWNHLYSEMKKVDGQNMHWLGATGNGKNFA
jgi:hypothetical protein